MAIALTNGSEIFGRLGGCVKWWYDLDAMKTTLEAVLDKAITDFNIKNVGSGSDTPSEADKAAYQAISIEVQRQKQEIDSLRYSVVNLVGGFLGTSIRELMNAPYSGPDAVLDYLIDQVADAGDSVKQNGADVADMAEDEDNSVLVADGVTLPTLQDPPTQMARDDFFSLTCIDATVVGQERWTLQSGLHGQFTGQVVTGQEIDWPEVGVAVLTVNPAPAHDETDASGKVSDWKMTGAVRGSNVASDGKVWVKFRAAPTLDDSNDSLAQVSNWNLTAASFADESDVDGKLHVSVVQEPASYQVLGGAKAQINAAGIILDNLGSSCTDDGTLYAKVIKAAGTSTGSKYTVELYSTSDRSTTLVASGEVDDAPASGEGALPQTVTLEAQAPYTLQGTLTLDAFYSTLTNDSDSTILVKVPRYFVRLYKSSSRSGSDLVSQGVSYEPTAANLTLAPEDNSVTAGDVDLNYIQDDDGIELTVDFYTADMYKADPADSDTTDNDIVARAGSLTNLLSGNAVGDLGFFPVHSSGLATVSLDIAADTVADGYVASTSVGYAVGDRFTFKTTTDDAGRFQTFLRENVRLMYRIEA